MIVAASTGTQVSHMINAAVEAGLTSDKHVWIVADGMAQDQVLHNLDRFFFYLHTSFYLTLVNNIL